MAGEDQLTTDSPHGSGRGYLQRLAGVAVCLGLILAVLFIYARVAHYGFVNYDDNEYVTENWHVRGGISWEAFQWAFTGFHAGHWHPLTWLSHMLDCQLFGADNEAAGGHHLVNVALHAVSSVLLLLALWRMTGQLWPSALVAGLLGKRPDYRDALFRAQR